MNLFTVIYYIELRIFIRLLNIGCPEITGLIVNSVIVNRMIFNYRPCEVRIVAVKKNRAVFTKSVKDFKLRLKYILS